MEPRPDRVWSQFQINNKKDTSVITVRVQRMSHDQLEECVDLLVNHFVKDATIGHNSGIHNNPAAVQECRQYMSALLRRPAALALVYLTQHGAEPRPRVVGVSVMTLVTKGDPEDIFQYQAQTKELGRYLAYLSHIMVRLYPPAELLQRYHVDRYYHDMGLIIHPDYRQMGIAKRDGALRRKVSAAQGVPLTSAWCTAEGSQRAFAADGWETVCEVDCEELGRQLGARLRDAPPSCKLLATRTDRTADQ